MKELKELNINSEKIHKLKNTTLDYYDSSWSIATIVNSIFLVGLTTGLFWFAYFDISNEPSSFIRVFSFVLPFLACFSLWTTTKLVFLSKKMFFCDCDGLDFYAFLVGMTWFVVSLFLELFFTPVFAYLFCFGNIFMILVNFTYFKKEREIFKENNNKLLELNKLITRQNSLTEICLGNENIIKNLYLQKSDKLTNNENEILKMYEDEYKKNMDFRKEVFNIKEIEIQNL